MVYTYNRTLDLGKEKVMIKIIAVLVIAIALDMIDDILGIDWKQYPKWKRQVHTLVFLFLGIALYVMLR